MRKIAILILVASCFLAAPVLAFELDPGNSTQARKSLTYAPGELLVKYKQGIPTALQEAYNVELGGVEIQEFPFIGVYHLEIPPHLTVEEAVKKFSADPNVEYAEPNYIVYADSTPDDPRFSELWGLHNTGQTGGITDADIDAPEAWDIQTGSSNVVIAVIDTGVDYNHEDLSSNMWTNPGETPDDGIDNDGNGFVDDVFGWDFCNNDNDPFDDHSHGTHCAGTIGAVGNNSTGVVGVNWTVRIMALKFLSAGGSGSTADAISCIEYATNMGADIMSNSSGGGGFSQALKDAITAAHDAGILFVASAGNAGTDNDGDPHYPSSYDVPNIIAVAATDHDDELASWSCYGATSVDLAAPGVSILSSIPGNSYGSKSGTSMATPHVAGLAGLVLSQFPALDNLAVKYNILNNVDVLSDLSGKILTEGRINAYNSLTSSETQINVIIENPGSNFAVPMDSSTLIKAAVTQERGPAVTEAVVTASFSNGDPDITLYDDGNHNDNGSGDGIYANDWTPGSSGSVTITVSASKAGFTSGSDTVTGTVIISYSYDDTVTYDWIDATVGTDTGITGDDSYATINIGFDFTFYENTYSSVKVSSNGYLTFGADGTDYSNDPIPSTTDPDDFIAPFWDDLYPPGGGAICYLLSGTSPNRKLTIEWYEIPHYSYRSGAVTFEVTLYESTNEMVFQYQDVVFGSSTYDYGRSGTIGVENATGSAGTQYSYNTASLSDSLAIRFYLPLAAPFIYVSQDGTCNGNTPCYSTIQGAVNAASSGSTIKIAGGSYGEDVSLNTNKNLIVKGGYNSTFTTQSSETTFHTMTISNGTAAVDKLELQ